MTALRLKERGALAFTHIIIDEGAQSREPEALGALLMADHNTHIIIAGDNKQVGPAVSVYNDVAGESGLGQSLLERLLNLYQRFNQRLRGYHRHSLLTNYRCHPSILMLASSLFYECTLLGRSDSETHPDAPFPLVFECSSLKRDDNEISSPVNQREAEILVKKALEFVQSWPVGKSVNKPRVAILAGSGRQVDCLRAQFNRQCRNRSDLPCTVDVTFTYTIQGSEFDGVFLSTHEPTDKDGRPRNVVRSICNEYVFNTVITRSRSLVVAVGNPFLLHQMGSHFPVNCWAEYIQRCIACQSLHLLEAPEAQNDELSQIVCALMDKVIPRQLLSEINVKEDISECDRVIDGYMRLLNSRSERLYGMKLVQDPRKGKNSWQSSTDKEVAAGNIVLAEITLSTHHRGTINRPNVQALKVGSLRERRCAFPGDLVPVDVATNERVLDEECERRFRETHFGKSLVCRVNPKNMIEFYPLDKRYPIIINLPSLTKHDKHGVTCFEPSTINDRLKVNNFIPKESAVNMVFVVKVLKWNKKCVYPLGITIGALPCGNSVFSGDLLLRIAHDISTADTGPQLLVAPCASNGCTDVHQFDDVITIDPQGSTDHDDALSCVHIPTSGANGANEYEFGVHITDVQKFVPKDSELDIIALKKGCSVYSSSDKCVSHMLPDPIVQEASILPRQTRDAFSVIARVSIREKNVVSSIDAVEIVKSRITSTSEMTYEQAQAFIYSKKGRKQVKNLWLVACHLRRERLGSAAAAAHISVSSLDEILHPEAHMLVEEMMIWANTAVAKKLLDHFPSIVRRQPKPKDDDLEALVKAYGRNMAVSLDLQQHVPQGQRLYRSVQVLHKTTREIENALNEGSVRKALHCVQFEHLQPQVAVTHALFNMIRGRASYCVPDTVDDDEGYAHDMLKCDQYTRFTSPIRRYVDLTVQRMLLAALQDEDNPYAEEVEKVQEICQTVKEREREADKYEDGHKSLELACELQQSSREYLCFVKKTEEGRLFLTFSDPALKSINRDVTTVHLKHLNATSIPQKESSSPPDLEDTPADTGDNQHCTWQVKVASANGEPKGFLSNPFLQSSGRHSHSAFAQITLFIPEEQGPVSQSNLKEQTHRLAINPFTHSVPESNWREMQRCLDPDVQMISTGKMKKLLALPSCQAPSTFPSISHSPLWIYKLHRPLQTCEVIKVQMSGSLSSRTQIITPSIQLLEVGPNLQVCIQHNSNPTECFTDTSLAKPPKGGHKSMNDYFLYWERLVLAEAATASLTDTDLLLITDVKLVWPTLNKMIDSQGQVYYQLGKGAIVDKTNSVCMELTKSFAMSSYDFLSINAGDLVCVRCREGVGSEVRGVLHMVVDSVDKSDEETADGEVEPAGIKVYLKFVGEKSNYISERMNSSLCSLSYEVQLIPLTLPYRRIYNCLKKLSARSSKPRLPHIIALGKANCSVPAYCNLPKVEDVLPADQAKVATTLWTNGDRQGKPDVNLNPFQTKAVRLACSNQLDFVMIQGPPGTGKSVTGAHIAYALAMKLRKDVGKVRRKENELNPCVMYCGPSQQSVNVVLDILVSSPEVQASGLKIVRVYSNAIEIKDFHGPKFNTQVFKAPKTDGKCDVKFADYALHHLVRRRNPEICSLDEEFAKLKSENMIPSFNKRSKCRTLITKTSIDVLKDNVDIVLCTCNEASSHRITWSVEPVYCIIDECAMATEPECMVPIRRAERVVLIGDHKQLQPVLGNKDAKNMGMSKSLFERYVDERHDSVHMLKTQYRMHESLCSFPSEEFYEGELQTDLSVVDKYKDLLDRLNRFWPQGRDSPLVFCDVVGTEEENHTGQRGTARVGLESKRNTNEAKKIAEIADILISDYDVRPEEIAALTPYSAQKEEIKAQLEMRDVEGVAVKTITDSQGSEFGIVLLSTVRSCELDEMLTAQGKVKEKDFIWKRENLGFIVDRHQICVGITRCKYGLVIVGNKVLLEYDITWRELIYDYEDRGCVVDEDSFP